MTAPARRRTLRIDDPVGAGAVAADDRPDGSAANGRLRELSIAEIHPNPNQPRKHFADESLTALAASVRERGVIQPIIVRPLPESGYELVAGERRWRAARLAALPTVPALVDEQLDGAASLEAALIENMAREDLSPIEEARTIGTLLDDLKITATALAVRLGRSRPDIAHTMRLLELPDEAIELVDAGMLSKGHGKALLTEPDHHRRRTLAQAAANYGWSVRALEVEIARAGTARRRTSHPPADQAAAAVRLEDTLTRATGCEVRARPHRQGYQIIVDHHAAHRLAELLAAHESLA